MNSPTINAPSIASSAVFIDLSISSWTGRKLDKRASTTITDQANAARGVANVYQKTARRLRRIGRGKQVCGQRT